MFGSLLQKAEPKVSHIQFSRKRDTSGSGSEDEELRSVIQRMTKRRRRIGQMSMGDSSVKDFDVTFTALTSRLIVLGIQILARLILPPHSNDGFKYEPKENSTNFLDDIVNSTLAGFTNWDGQYFLHISTHGYTQINTIAFFPLFPTIVGYIARFEHFFTPFLSIESTEMITAWIFNTYLFIQCALALKSTIKYLDNGMGNLVRMTVMLFCFNPASIFFSAYYSETLFAFLTFNMILELLKGNTTSAVVLASLSAVTRSNGLLNFGFVAAFTVRNVLIFEGRKRGRIDLIYEFTHNFLLCCAGVVPFIYWQIYCIWKFCDGVVKTKDDLLPFCDLSQIPYSYVQGTNWSVGFLEYFQFHQIPNFILAAPILIISSFESFKRFRYYAKLLIVGKEINALPSLAMASHCLFLVLFTIFFAHVQISTRMILSSCPCLYIYIAKSIRTETYLFRAHRLDWLRYSFNLHAWFLIYFFVGTVGFSLGYPWT